MILYKSYPIDDIGTRSSSSLVAASCLFDVTYAELSGGRMLTSWYHDGVSVDLPMSSMEPRVAHR